MWANFDDVMQQMQAFGLLVRHEDVAPGRKVRCRMRDGGAKKRGWFKLFELPISGGSGYLLCGVYGAAFGAEYVTHKIELPKSERKALTAEEIAAWKARMADERKRAEAEEKARQDRAAAQAEVWWRGCVPSGQSAYLKRKGVEAFGLRFSPQGRAVVPVMDAERRVYGLQVLMDEKNRDGRDKDFVPPGMAKKGHFFLLGMVGPVLLVAEGYATAATLHMATGLPVAVAFDANNLLPVSQALHKKYRRTRILVCADDDYLQKCKACGTPTPVADAACCHCGDAHGQANPGVSHAGLAAAAVGGEVAVPVFADERPVDKKGATDFNDLHLAEGLHVVTAQIETRLAGLGWHVNAKAAPVTQPGGGGDGRRRQACAVMELDQIVERFVPLDDGTGEFVFDHWTNKVVKKSQMLALLAAGVRGDDIKRHPLWISRGAFFLDQVGFDPAGSDSNVRLNTWQGWPMQPKEGCCDRLLELLRYLCGNDENSDAVYSWLLCWMAYPLQHPGAKMASAVIMHGPQGTGKSTVFQALAKIYGDYATVLNQRGLEDKFNSDWVDSKLFILAEEVVTRAEMWHIKNELKELVTGEWIRVNPKNVAAYRQRNHVNTVYLSNENQPLPLDNDDRRHLVVYTPPALSESFYDQVFVEIEAGGIEAFYSYLLQLDLSGFHPKKRPPMTEAKRNLIALSAPSEVRFVTEWILGDLDLPVCPALAADVYAAYLRWCRQNGESRPRPSNQFHGAIAHMEGWSKSRYRIYTSESALKTEPKPLIIPPADALAKHDGAQPPGDEPAKWLTASVRRFASALGGGQSDSARYGT